MADVRERLIECFQTVFPDLPPDRIAAATTDNLPEWDSMQAQTLMAVIEETFLLRIGPQDLPAFTSFAKILELLARRSK